MITAADAQLAEKPIEQVRLEDCRNAKHDRVLAESRRRVGHRVDQPPPGFHSRIDIGVSN